LNNEDSGLGRLLFASRFQYHVICSAHVFPFIVDTCVTGYSTYFVLREIPRVKRLSSLCCIFIKGNNTLQKPVILGMGCMWMLDVGWSAY
jgi:hypothetical protein